jgi:hypothetical protein
MPDKVKHDSRSPTQRKSRPAFDPVAAAPSLESAMVIEFRRLVTKADIEQRHEFLADLRVEHVRFR